MVRQQSPAAHYQHKQPAGCDRQRFKYRRPQQMVQHAGSMRSITLVTLVDSLHVSTAQVKTPTGQIGPTGRGDVSRVPASTRGLELRTTAAAAATLAAPAATRPPPQWTSATWTYAGGLLAFAAQQTDVQVKQTQAAGATMERCHHPSVQRLAPKQHVSVVGRFNRLSAFWGF